MEDNDFGRSNYILCGSVVIASVEDHFHPLVHKGFLGKVTQSDRGFSIEVRKIDYLLETEIGKTTWEKCGHQLGDGNCKVNLSNYTQNSAISSINSNFDFIINGSYADGIFNRGWIKFTAGANAGLTRDISYNNGGQIVTFQPFPHLRNIGDSVEVVQGCDKTSRCKFSVDEVRGFGSRRA